MSIIRVVDNWKGWDGDVTINNVTLRPEGTVNRTFHVEFSENDDTFKPVSALYATGIPQPWDVLPGFPWIYVIGYSAKMGDGPTIVDVTVKYKIFEDPLVVPPVIRYGFATDTDEIHKALAPRNNMTDPATELVLQNSVGESPETAVMKEYRDLLLTIDVNRAIFDHDLASLYIDAVNGDNFFGFLPGKVKCRVIEGTQDRAGCFNFWRHHYEFQVRTFKSDPLGIGWRRRFLDEGFRKLVKSEVVDGETVTYDPPQKRAIMLASCELNEDGSDNTAAKKYIQAARPVKLNGAGGILGEGEENKYIEFEDFDRLPFSMLGLE